MFDFFCHDHFVIVVLLFPYFLGSETRVCVLIVQARRGYRLVYGGGNVGLMGIIAETVRDNGGSVVGVMPEGLMSVEVSGTQIGEVIVVKCVHLILI